MENQEQKGDVKEEGKCCTGNKGRCAVKALAVIGLLSIGYFAGHCHKSCDVKHSAEVVPASAPATPVAPATAPKK